MKRLTCFRRLKTSLEMTERRNMSLSWSTMNLNSSKKQTWAQCDKPFLSVIYKFSYSSRVFVCKASQKLARDKRLPGSNTVAFYDNS
jgi:hypothetical protein